MLTDETPFMLNGLMCVNGKTWADNCYLNTNAFKCISKHIVQIIHTVNNY